MRVAPLVRRPVPAAQIDGQNSDPPSAHPPSNLAGLTPRRRGTARTPFGPARSATSEPRYRTAPRVASSAPSTGRDRWTGQLLDPMRERPFEHLGHQHRHHAIALPSRIITGKVQIQVGLDEKRIRLATTAPPISNSKILSSAGPPRPADSSARKPRSRACANLSG